MKTKKDMDETTKIHINMNVFLWILVLITAMIFTEPKILLTWIFCAVHLVMIFGKDYWSED